ncbi:alpha/beta hydrolase family protein [Flavivirga algicola]|uniref:Carboxylic ester hydrolase n=1 Tax=Flavivirga algicola TaxID=2729136 RepID=A0ABX1RU39_9FLAO|nr:hypothetical protein [Flavivirga algicola]NMH87060.1 hypothetical protein [Flavivirga algicola]
MRYLEIVLLLLVTFLPFTKRILLKILEKKYLLAALVTILVSHLLIEGWRWQMFPVYLLLIIILYRIISTNAITNYKLTFLRIVGYVVVVLLLIPGWVLPNILPVFQLPEPTGKYTVGTYKIHLKTNIDEVITKNEGDKRELMIKVWYPSLSSTNRKQEPYLDHANRVGFVNKYLGFMPTTALNYLDEVKTHVYPNIPIANESFPVLIFSHGYGSNASGYYTLLTEIASQGYIILNMNHTYESLGAVFPNGKEVFFDYDFQATQNVNSMKHITPIREAFKKNLPFEERHSIIREASKGYAATKMIKRWAKDITYTLDQLEYWNNEGFFKGKLDLDRIGVFGHSRGGGAAGQATIEDARIKASANIDGVQWGEMMDTIYQTPFLYLSSDWGENHEDVNLHVYKNKSTNYFYEAKLLTAAHPNFMDIPFMIPVKELAQTGNIDVKLGVKITNELVIAFFNSHLRGDSISIKEISKKYDLLKMTVHEGDSLK